MRDDRLPISPPRRPQLARAQAEAQRDYALRFLAAPEIVACVNVRPWLDA